MRVTSETNLRTLRNREEDTLLEILESAFGFFHNATEVRALLSSNRFDSRSCFIAEEGDSPIGSVAVTRLPRDKWFVIRYLAAVRSEIRARVAEQLLAKALDHTKSRASEFVRATTPAIEPYVGIYKKFGFVPVRRDFRISWDLTSLTPEETTALNVEEVSEGTSQDAARMYVNALTPYWNWRTEEHGGPEAVGESFRGGLRRGERWLLCSSDNRMVGLTGMIVDYYGPGEGRFRGAYVLPEHRGKGIGLAVMKEALNMAKRMGQHRLVVYTFSYLDCLAPGALLYLKSAGKIEAEYTQLSMS